MFAATAFSGNLNVASWTSSSNASSTPSTFAFGLTAPTSTSKPNFARASTELVQGAGFGSFASAVAPGHGSPSRVSSAPGNLFAQAQSQVKSSAPAFGGATSFGAGASSFGGASFGAGFAAPQNSGFGPSTPQWGGGGSAYGAAPTPPGPNVAFGGRIQKKEDDDD